MLHKDIVLEEIPEWCAGAFLSGVSALNVKTLTKKELNNTCDGAYTHSCILVMLNEDEKEYCEPYLRKLGFKRSPQINNWGHAGRKTWIYLYQIPKKIWSKNTNFDPNTHWTLL
jgi:hypothetical protein